MFYGEVCFLAGNLLFQLSFLARLGPRVRCRFEPAFTLFHDVLLCRRLFSLCTHTSWLPLWHPLPIRLTAESPLDDVAPLPLRIETQHTIPFQKGYADYLTTSDNLIFIILIVRSGAAPLICFRVDIFHRARFSENALIMRFHWVSVLDVC